MRAWAVRFEPRGLERDEAGLGFIEVAWVCLAFRTHVVTSWAAEPGFVDEVPFCLERGE